MIQYYKQDHPKEVRHDHSLDTSLRQGELLAFFKSYYFNDSVFLTLSRRDVEKATSLIVKHFCRFELKIHFGIRSAGKSSKIEAMCVRGSHQGYKKYSEIPLDLVADIDLESNLPESSHLIFVEFFKYLVSFISRGL